MVLQCHLLLVLHLLEDLHISVKAFLQRNKRFGAFNSLYFLQFIMQYKTKLVNVFTDDLCKHAIVSSCII